MFWKKTEIIFYKDEEKVDINTKDKNNISMNLNMLRCFIDSNNKLIEDNNKKYIYETKNIFDYVIEIKNRKYKYKFSIGCGLSVDDCYRIINDIEEEIE